jgi:hypothetical protein
MIIGNSNMNSINAEDSAIRKLFDFILREGEINREKGMAYFPLSADKDIQSYYEPSKHEQYVNFSFIDTKDQKGLANSFQDLWKGKNNEAFLPLAVTLSEIAFTLKETEGEQTTDLSPFVYTLY